MAIHLDLSFTKDSQCSDRKDYRELKLIVAITESPVVMGALMLVDILVMQTIFSPTAPTILDKL